MRKKKKKIPRMTGQMWYIQISHLIILQSNDDIPTNKTSQNENLKARPIGLSKQDNQ